MGNLAAMRGQINRAQRDWDRGLSLTAERDLSGRYLARASVRAIVERLLLDDPARARRVLDDALERYPLESLAPLDRPYESLARAYAAAGDPERGRELIAEFYYQMTEGRAVSATMAEEVVPAARAAFESLQRGFAVDPDRLDDLLDARRDLARAEIQYTNALVDYHQALAGLEGIVGHGLSGSE